jgi:hypothetical protein
MSEIPALEALGRDLGAALRRELPGVRRRRRMGLVAGLLTVIAAVPAAGTVTDWAGPAGGETPLPTQVRSDLRVVLADGRDARGPWRLEAYRAQVEALDGRVGVCVFLSRRDGGTGRCAPESRLGPIVDTGQDFEVGLVGGVVRSAVVRVEVALEPFVVALSGHESRVRGLRAVDAEGRTVGASGTPAAPTPSVVARPSLVYAPEAHP